jgi:hypothetical protein
MLPDVYKPNKVIFALNPHARNSAREYIAAYIHHPNPEIRKKVSVVFTPKEGEVPGIEEGAIIVPGGGDGSVWKLLLQMLKMQNPGILATRPDGTNNGFDRSVRVEGEVYSLEDLLLGNYDSEKLKTFYPGMVQAVGGEGSTVFAHATSNTRYAGEQERLTALFRQPHIPRKLKSYLGAFRAFQTLHKTGELDEELHLAMTAAFDRWVVNPDQHVFSNTLTHLFINMDNFFERVSLLAILLAIMPLHRVKIPERIARIIQTESLIRPTEGKMTFIPDGERVTLPYAEEVEYKRHPVGVPTVALNTSIRR